MLTATANGLDTTLVNGLQILPAWQEYVHNPSGKVLGAFGVVLSISHLRLRADLRLCPRVD